MIYFVDEDHARFDAWIQELRVFRNLEVEVFADADTAFGQLSERDDVQLAILDIMLSAGSPTSARFSEARTDGYLETGLKLLDDLAEVRGDVFPRRAILLTNTVNASTLRAAQLCAGRHNVPVWKKSNIDSPLQFGDQIEDRLRHVAGFRADRAKGLGR
ncbi:MAG: hypothetical protein OEY23_23405 [Acidimicrobiia bacterium]|nr:hypothetical protein [Acidimicrobiia bacterium]